MDIFIYIRWERLFIVFYLELDCKCRTAGVKEYWIVDYEKNLVLVYDFQNEDGDDYTFSDTIQVGIYPDSVIDLSSII